MPDESKKVFCDRAYIDTRLADLDRAYVVQFRGLNRAIDKAEDQLRERLAGMNEIRESMRDQAATLATQKELDLRIKSVDASIKSLEISRAYLVGMATAVSFITSLLVTVILSNILAG